MDEKYFRDLEDIVAETLGLMNIVYKACEHEELTEFALIYKIIIDKQTEILRRVSKLW